MSLPCIFCKRMHLQYIESLSCVNTLGLCPKPQPHLRRRGGRRLKPNHLTLWRSVGSAQGVRVKCTASPPLTPSTSVRVAKRSKRMELETCQGLRRSNRGSLAFTGLEATQRSVVRVQEVSPAPLPRGERGCGQRPGVGKTLWGRAVGDSVP